MKVIVCVKQVPNTNEVRIDPIKGTLIREGVESILNPDDANALEGALRLKDAHEAVHITVLTMGPAQARDMLQECLAMGADEAILLSDRAFGGADTWATSNTLAAAIKKMGDFDLIFAGRQAIDGDTAQVGPQTAERLGIPQITYVQSLEVVGEEVIVERQLEDGHMLLRAKMPVLLTAVKEMNTPRYMSVKGIFEAFEKEISVWTLADLEISSETVGLKASPTKVYKSFPAKTKGKGMMLEGTAAETSQTLVAYLKEKHII